jgi:hypothetical protein|tara:strand:+ start:339 stop:554 length:216 start_codon:yes stop_codon:yes gene_type:complete
MNKNVGKIDKTLRIVLALVATYFAYNQVFEYSWITYGLYGIAIILLSTSLMNSCPLYSILGKSTCKVNLEN